MSPLREERQNLRVQAKVMATPGCSASGCSLCLRSVQLSMGHRDAKDSALRCFGLQLTERTHPAFHHMELSRIGSRRLSYWLWVNWEQTKALSKGCTDRHFAPLGLPPTPLPLWSSPSWVRGDDSGRKENKGMLDNWWQYQPHSTSGGRRTSPALW